MIPTLPINSKNKKRQSNHHAESCCIPLAGIATPTDRFCFFRGFGILCIQQLPVAAILHKFDLRSAWNPRYPCTGAAKPRDLKQGAKAMRCDISGVLGWQNEIATGYIYIYINRILYMYIWYSPATPRPPPSVMVMVCMCMYDGCE